MNINIQNTFRVFESRNYNLFFFGQLISRIGMWMQRTAVIWVIYSMTHSAFMIGVATFAEQFPSFLFSPLGGIVADRYDRYKVLMWTQVISAMQAVTLTFLYFNNDRQVWIILLLSTLLGIANAFDVPARQPMVNDIIKDPQDLPNAIAMNSSLNNLARLIGPALSGFVLATYGAGICFASNAVSFIAVIASLTLMQVPRHVPHKNKKISADLTDGLKYVRQTPEIGATLLLLALICFLVITYNTLLPVFAREIFKGDAKTYGYLNAVIGTGSVVSTFYLASKKNGSDLKRLLFSNILLLGAGLILFSQTNYFPVALLWAAICGFSTMLIVPICNTIIQMTAIPEMRGRVIGFFAMAFFGMLPLGSMLIGWVSKHLGTQNSLLAQGILSFLIAIAFSRFLLKKQTS